MTVSLEAFAAKNTRSTGKPCSVCALPDGVRAVTDEALRTKRHPRSVIAKWLRDDRGLEISMSMLDNHYYKGHAE